MSNESVYVVLDFVNGRIIDVLTSARLARMARRRCSQPEDDLVVEGPFDVQHNVDHYPDS